jgi:hypothetical protein
MEDFSREDSEEDGDTYAGDTYTSAGYTSTGPSYSISYSESGGTLEVGDMSPKADCKDFSSSNGIEVPAAPGILTEARNMDASGNKGANSPKTKSNKASKSVCSTSGESTDHTLQENTSGGSGETGQTSASGSSGEAVAADAGGILSWFGYPNPKPSVSPPGGAVKLERQNTLEKNSGVSMLIQ